jgi:RepB DNA-primase from phage plasmid
MPADDRTRTAVSRQLKGMGCKVYDVGVRHPERGVNRREWNASEVIKALDWLKQQNHSGCHIYVRPSRSHASRLILVDDLNPSTLAQMRSGPHEPAVIVQTSPANFQAWLKLANDEPADVRRHIARFLAREYGGDPNSADSAHYGRLAGFTNRKPEHVDDAGRLPFVLLDSYKGQAASGAAELVNLAKQAIAHEQAQAKAMAAFVQAQARSVPQASSAVHEDQALGAWYQKFWDSLKAQFTDAFDASRADWMVSVALLKKGHAFDTVAAAISSHSPGLESRKGTSAMDYVTRTAGKAEIWCELEREGAVYADVSHELLEKAQQRAAERAQRVSSVSSNGDL